MGPRGEILNRVQHDNIFFESVRDDGSVKSRDLRFFVIPAKAGIQSFQYVRLSLDM